MPRGNSASRRLPPIHALTMDASLASIRTALEQLHAQNVATISHAKRTAYFTNAVLNPQRLDILELIRDADAFEASLYVSAPPEPTPGPSTAPAEPKPHFRSVPVPTPLKQSHHADSDARTYLLAAEKLLQNYHNAPRARKHIRMLLKRDAELQRHISRYHATIDQAGKAQLFARTPPPPPTRAKRSEALQAEIQREKMEILALESMLSEKETAPPTTPAARSPRPAPTPQRTPRRASPAKSPALSKSVAAPPTPRTPKNARPLAQSVSSPRTPTTRVSPPKTQPTASPSLVPLGVVPTATPELERITTRIWDLFGEHVRYAAPGCKAASFPDTFAILRALEQGGPQAMEVDVHGDAPNPSVPPSVGIMMMAHVLLLLMRTPPPYTLSLPLIKSYSDKWWKQEGQATIRAGIQDMSTRNQLIQQLGIDAADLDQTGDALATRAVYGLVAKKLLRIQRTGGAANVRFA